MRQPTDPEALAFSFDGRELRGRPGETIAAALIAGGVDVVGRSPYRDRPRGIFAAGDEEPNALVEVTLGGRVELMARATTTELVDGMRLRSLAGRARATVGAEPVRCDRRHRHCDVLVIGGGPAGVAAAEAAARSGARVLLAHARPELGADAAGLGDAPEATVLTRATAIGLYDHGYAVIAQHGGVASRWERLWHVRARRIVLATGAIERPLAFADNDRPGIMLAGAARAFATEFGIAAGKRAVVFTTNDSAYRAAHDLLAAGVAVALVVDARPQAPSALAASLAARGVEVLAGAAVAATAGEPRLGAVTVAPLGVDGRLGEPTREVACDLLAVSGGWSPALHLYAQAGGRQRYDPARAAFVPDGEHPYLSVVGAAAGGESDELPPRALWAVPPLPGGDWENHFVDLQRDATVADLRRAVAAGLRSPEHVKRWTTIGTGEDQGKTANVLALGILAELTEVPLTTLAPTTYRPPFTPVPLSLLAGRDRGRLQDPVRSTPIHAWHERRGAAFEDVGQWRRARHYRRPGEDADAAVLRECAAVRDAVGLFDASTLGKIDVQGPDAGEFLDRMYTNPMSTVPVGTCRYGVLCKADGMVFDDGVAMRLAADRFVLTTTTGGAAAVMDWLEEWLQTEWPELRVRLTSVTDHWAAIAIAGPRSRELLARLAPGVALEAEAFPFMAIREDTVAGAPARLCRISFSGELAFEIHVPARFGLATWEAAIAAGKPLGVTPYGTDAMHVLRAEKGYLIVGQDTDGSVTPDDAGIGWIVSAKKPFFVGRRSLRRPDTARPDRRQLVGLLPDDPGERLPEGAQLLRDDGGAGCAGHVTSSYMSAALGRSFALALLERGRERHGETVGVAYGECRTSARVTGTVLFDPEGVRRDGDGS